jgi:hypothetical protein
MKFGISSIFVYISHTQNFSIALTVGCLVFLAMQDGGFSKKRHGCLGQNKVNFTTITAPPIPPSMLLSAKYTVVSKFCKEYK